MALLRAPILFAVPLAIRQMFDTALPGRHAGSIIGIGLAVFVLYLVDAALAAVLRRRAATDATRATALVRHNVITRLYALPRRWHETQDPGILHGAVVQDCDRLNVLIAQLLMWVIPTAITSVTLAAVAILLAPGFAALLAVGLAVMMTALLPLTRRTVREGRRASRAMRLMGAHWRTSLRLLPATQLHGAEQVEIDRRSEDIRNVATFQRRLQHTQASLLLIVDLTAALTTAVMLIVGGLAITHHALTVGSLLSFYAVGVLLFRQVTLAAPGVASALSDTGSVERLVDLLRTEEPPPYRGQRVHAAGGRIEFSDVTFGFDESQSVLTEIDLLIEPGEHVAILGPNGAGKSTLVALILGVYRPDVGTIRFDGIPMDELDVRILRQSIGLAPQDPVMFPATVAENITYARPGATTREVSDAAELSTVAAFIPGLQAGLDTEIGDEGTRLSGGQRQRVALARALVGSPKLLILDEPSTYLDSQATDELLDRLERLPARPTVLTITHDARVAARAHRVVHLRDGRILSSEPASDHLHTTLAP